MFGIDTLSRVKKKTISPKAAEYVKDLAHGTIHKYATGDILRYETQHPTISFSGTVENGKYNLVSIVEKDQRDPTGIHTSHYSHAQEEQMLKQLGLYKKIDPLTDTFQNICDDLKEQGIRSIKFYAVPTEKENLQKLGFKTVVSGKYTSLMTYSL